MAVDGKTARRSFDRQEGRRPLHMVNAWAVAQRLVLSQQKVAGDSNEIEALPAWRRNGVGAPFPNPAAKLALLALDGHIVTADAMHCQKATAQAILERGGDYCLALKGNQRALHDDVRLWLDDPATVPDDAHQTVDGDHGRIETRRAATTWPGWPRFSWPRSGRRGAPLRDDHRGRRWEPGKRPVPTGTSITSPTST